MENRNYLSGTPAQRIKDRLDELHMTQAALAEQTGLPESTLSRIMQGRVQSIKSQDLARIARGLRVSTDFLLGLTPLPSPKSYELRDLGLSADALTVILCRQVNPDILNRLLTHKNFPALTQLIAAYASPELNAGLKAQSELLGCAMDMLTGLPTTRTQVSALKAASGNTADIAYIQNVFRGIVVDIKKEAPRSDTNRAVANAFSEIMQAVNARKEEGDTPPTPEQMAGIITDYVTKAEGLDAHSLDDLKGSLAALFQQPPETQSHA